MTAPERDRRAADARDAAARERALDVHRSFLVQAPAGSGKTELLIQRYLALLACVARPEAIVAMTFTRKAAGEMRERIVRALRDARTETPVREAHELRTRKLAQAVLAQDARHGWRLDEHPARLAVFTIDALTSGLARQAPLATGLGAAPRYEERAGALYEEAARVTLAAAAADDASWRRLLAHLDNDAARAVELIAAMLARRDQWAPLLVGADRARLREQLEATLVAEIADGLAAAAAAFPPALAQALIAQERFAARELAESGDASGLSDALAACAAGGGLPPATVAGLDRWRAFAGWLLVGKGARFRKAIDKSNGFPPKGTGKGADDRARRKDAMKALLAELDGVDGLADALDAARCLPPPGYGEASWGVVDALLDVLPSAAGRLLLVFGDALAIDFTQATLAALDALGADDAPSELLLKLDLRIEHLLVDEFQDTSYTQLALIERLTAGWQQGDGRTLFAVGDPMQSIYRFRAAEVRLFVDAQDERRVGAVPVDTLVLSRNFRSQAGLVEWVNAVFPRVLGAHSDRWRGTVAFAPAVPANDALPGDAVTVEAFRDAGAEADAVVAHVRAALDAGDGDVAVLVRARPHLAAVLPALRDAEIAFAAVELDALAERQAVRDLSSLAHALAQPADRHAWLAVLRAPWCGLVLPDLFAVAAEADARHRGFVGELVGARAPVPGISDDGRRRLERVAAPLVGALAARGRAGLAERTRGAWLALGGGATLDEPIDLEAAERFFSLLAEHEAAGDVANWSAFTAALGQLYAAPDPGATPRVQVMTLHKAKGLQFDTVVMPGLARCPKRPDPEVLRWRRRPGGVLLAPTKAKGGDDDAVGAYLKRLAAAEESAELARLLYVGCTRAKRRLHLTAVLATQEEADDGEPPAWKPARAGSAWAKFRDVAEAAPAPPPAGAPAAPATFVPPLLARLPVEWSVPLPEPGVAVAALPADVRESLPFDWAREAARHTGTVAHRLFAQIAREGIAAWSAARARAQQARVRTELAAAGVDDAELGAATAAVIAAVEGLLADPRGRWLFDPAHAEAASEWMLAGVDDGGVAHVVIDRTFVADGARWIVDFKTGAHEGADVEAFLAAEVERYRSQLERYARFVAALDPRPIRLALYYPLLAGWRAWAYTGAPDGRSAAGGPEIR